MRSTLLLGPVLGFLATAAAWSKEDHEIFRLRDEIELHEGSGVTFYDFLGARPSANQDEINKAYRTRSRALHPDKAKQNFIASASSSAAAAAGTASPSSSSSSSKKRKSKPYTDRELRQYSKQASERFARLGLIAAILRGPERDRYDHFLSHGFPRWRGTGYYYARYRPGLGVTLLGLFIFMGGAVHYVALFLGWRSRRQFAERLVKQARQDAWGLGGGSSGVDGSAPAGSSILSNVPGFDTMADATGAADAAPAAPMNRRERRLQAREESKESKGSGKNSRRRSRSRTPATDPGNQGLPPPGPGEPAPEGATRRVTALNGKPLVVDRSGRVFLEEEVIVETDDAEGVDAPVEAYLYLLDPASMTSPGFTDTVLYRAPVWLAGLSLGRLQALQAQYLGKASGSAGGAVRGPKTPDSPEGFVLVEEDADKVAAAIMATGSGTAAESPLANKGSAAGKKRKGKGGR